MSTYYILSLDGGGIRGLLTATMLERLINKRPGLLERIDLLAGTSTGAILALGLAYGLTPAELRELYEQEGDRIFADSFLDTVRGVGFMRGSKYSNKHLRRALAERFGEATLGDLEKKVLIPSFNLDSMTFKLNRPRMWKPKFFHNYPGYGSDQDEPMVDVALRSSAAPIYFPVYQGYVDGFVVANNPSMCALAQVLGTGSADLEEVVLLSIGTGLNMRYLPQEDANWGWRQWMFQVHPMQRQRYVMPLIYMMWEGGVDLANYQCHQLLGERFHRLDAVLPEVIDIDDVSRMSLLRRVGSELDLQDTLAWVDTHFPLDAGPEQAS